jgi:hypothetical protein
MGLQFKSRKKSGRWRLGRQPLIRRLDILEAVSSGVNNGRGQM